MPHVKLFSKEDLNNAITSDDVLGKSVIDARGRAIGVVDKIFIEPKTVDTIGISIDKGILDKGLVIGTGYIDRVTDHGVLLTIKPAPDLKGMKVFDVVGKYVGKVLTIETFGTQNRVKSITIKSGWFKQQTITYHNIKTLGHNIILSVPKEKIE